MYISMEPRTQSETSDVRLLAELAQKAARHTGELLRAELALAKEELRRDIRSMKKRALTFAVGIMLFQVALAMLALGVVLWLGARATGAFAAGGVLTATAVVCALYSTRAVRGHVITVVHDRLVRDTNTIIRSTNEP